MEPLRTESLEMLLKKYIDVTRLFRVIERVPISEDRLNEVSFVGELYTDDCADDLAVVSLLMKLDLSLFFGTGGKGIKGLLEVVQPMTDREAFWERYSREKDTHNLRIFEPSFPAWIDEGELPPPSKRVFAVGVNALRWHQLMPMTKIPLVSMREGHFTRAIDIHGVRQPKHENTPEIPRYAALIYGKLEVVNPEQVFILHEGGV